MNSFPNDWPEPGPIDLDIQDLPHRSSEIEWWYVNSHFETEADRKLSLFAAFFRVAVGKNEDTDEIKYMHSIIWALSDVSNHIYYSNSRLDRNAPEAGLERIKLGLASRDPRLNKALKEILQKGRLPLPDHMIKGDMFVSDSNLALDFGGDSFAKQADGSYRLSLNNPHAGVCCDLVFHPQKPPVRHGDHGIANGIQSLKLFYYFISRCHLTGTVSVDGNKQCVKDGTGWYDHNFGTAIKKTEIQKKSKKEGDFNYNNAWNWTGIQLDNNYEITVFAVFDGKTGELSDQRLIVIDPDGKRIVYNHFKFEPLHFWRSTRTFNSYPTSWWLQVLNEDIEFTLEACFEDQEFMTILSTQSFWEGRCTVKGQFLGKRISGLAYVERSGLESIHDLNDFFQSVSKEVRKSLEENLPLKPSAEQLIDLVASKDHDYYLEDIEKEQLVRTLFQPVRDITDRGGKCWRSYAALVCIDIVGGDSREFVQWLAMAELIHVGSLIIDDVQDQSNTRRGGPTSHLIYGEPLAINAATFIYFSVQKLLLLDQFTDAQKIALYKLYFEALRAGHAGQAIDIDGMDDLMEGIVESGDSSQLEKRILACHRLKTAVPAASLARMGAIAGGGNQAQIEAVGQFFEAIGMAFQIIDDVLNLRGFKGALKVRGEDLSHGKVTLPMAKAMSRFSWQDRAWFWNICQSKPKDPSVVASLIEKIEACGALDACVQQANDFVETTWHRIEPQLTDSIYKIMLRAFGWYVLERHY